MGGAARKGPPATDWCLCKCSAHGETGAIVRQGKALGIPTPVNEVLTNLVRMIEETYDKTVRN